MWVVFGFLALALVVVGGAISQRLMRRVEAPEMGRRGGLWWIWVHPLLSGLVLAFFAAALADYQAKTQAETAIRAERTARRELAADLTDAALGEVRGTLNELKRSDLELRQKHQSVYGRPLGVEILLRSEAHMAVATAEERAKLQRGLAKLPISKSFSDPWVKVWGVPPSGPTEGEVEVALEAMGYLKSELERQSKLRRPGAG